MYCLQYMIDFKHAYIICIYICTYSMKEKVGKEGNDMETRGCSLNEMIMDGKTNSVIFE